jgi:DNA repair photolyase
MEELQLLPVKLVPGFIAIDFTLGCAGCNFCVARRNPLVNEIFERRTSRALVSDVSRFAAALSALPSYSRAKVPLRIGNDSDFAYQRRPVRELLSAIDPDHPVVVLTRFPLERDDIEVLNRRARSTLLKVTLTPPSSYLDGFASPIRVLESAAAYEGNLLVTIGPLVADNFGSAAAIIDTLPQSERTSVYLKQLDKEGLPAIAHLPEMPARQFRELEERVSARGFRLNSFMLCLLFGNLGREDPRSSDVPDNELHYCETCTSVDLCWTDAAITAARIAAVCAELGVEPDATQQVGFRSYRVTANVPTAFGDEAYLSYRLGRKVRFTATAAGTANHQCLASEEVVRRWERIGFFSPAVFRQFGRQH